MSLKNIVVFIGPPGSGKGSLSNICVQELGWVQLSTGNLCRKHIAEKTALGKEINFAIKSGNLVSDSLISSMVEEWLSEGHAASSTVILDGYPRTAEQARLLDDVLKRKFDSLKLYLVRLVVNDDLLIQRLSSRVICQNKDCQAVYSLTESSALTPREYMKCDLCGSQLGRRKDDDIETVKERLKIYRKHEQDLLDYYKRMNKPVMELNVEKPLEMVFRDFKKMMGLGVR